MCIFSLWHDKWKILDEFDKSRYEMTTVVRLYIYLMIINVEKDRYLKTVLWCQLLYILY